MFGRSPIGTGVLPFQVQKRSKMPLTATVRSMTQSPVVDEAAQARALSRRLDGPDVSPSKLDSFRCIRPMGRFSCRSLLRRIGPERSMGLSNSLGRTTSLGEEAVASNGHQTVVAFLLALASGEIFFFSSSSLSSLAWIQA